MIHKPTNPFPYNTVINLDDYPKELTFSASVYNSSPVRDARLKINVAGTPYYFSQDTIAYTLTWENTQYSVYDSSNRFYLWDSWFNNWIYFKATDSPSTYYWSKFVYDSVKNTVTCYGNFRTQTGSSFEELDRPVIERTTTPVTVGATSKGTKVGKYTGTTADQYMKYTHEFQDPGNDVPMWQSHVNGSDIILLKCNKGKKYQYRTGITSTNTDSSIPIYGAASNDAKGLLQPNGNYSWQMRLYEDTDKNYLPNNCLGYGFVCDIVEDSSWPWAKSYFKLRPHINIERNMASGDSGYYQSSLGDRGVSEKYYIVINGKVGQIAKFWNSDISLHNTKIETDSYGDPLYGYPGIEWLDDEPTVDVGTQYAIFCNYTDSDEFYFSTTGGCELTLSYLSQGEAKETLESDDCDITLERSDLQLSGEYGHSYGAIVSRYRVLLYKIENDTETLVDDTDYIQDSDISYSYNKMINGEKYRLNIEVVDTNGYSIKRSINITVRYDDIVVGISDAVRTDSYPQHNSIIVDWGRALGDFSDMEPNKDGNNGATFIGFDVYKRIGDKDKLYQIASRNTTGIVEDFLVGDKVEYVYYIYPVYLTSSGEQIQTPLVSNPITLSHGRMKLVGLNLSDDNNNIYTIDTDNLWVFGLELSDNGATVVNSKTFTDTQSRYSKETVAPTQYVTKQVSGLLGKIDCSNENADYLDTYDNIVDWRDFVGGSQLKAFVDLRGVIYICDTEANPTDSYNEKLDYAASVTFTIHEMNSLDYMYVFARDLEYNPLSFILLSDRYDKLLRDNTPLYLTTERTDAS